MSAMMLNDIFNAVLETKSFQKTKGGIRFDRREKISAVFPESVIKYLDERSASYLTWFLNDDRRGDSVREYVGKLLDDDTFGFMQEMLKKCRSFLDLGNAQALQDVWIGLLDRLGTENPLFIRGSEGALRMKKMAETVPQRSLSIFLLEAATGGLTSQRFEKILSCWHLLDREICLEDGSDPLSAERLGEIFYVDGRRSDALLQFKKAASMIENKGGPFEKENEGNRLVLGSGRVSDAHVEVNAGKLLFRIGLMYQQGDGCIADHEKAETFFKKSAAHGFPEAYFSLGLMQLKDGDSEEAKEYFDLGSQAGDAACLRMLGNAYYAGEALAGGCKDLQAAKQYFLRGACREHISKGDAYCQYMLGRILEQEMECEDPVDGLLSGKEADPEYWYEAAARGGSEDASAALNRLRWYAFGGKESWIDRNNGRKAGGSVDHKEERMLESIIADAEGRKYCLMNSYSGNNRTLAESLPEGEYFVLACDPSMERNIGPGSDAGFLPEDHHDGMAVSACVHGNTVFYLNVSIARVLYLITERLSATVFENFPEILLMALDDNEQKNIRDGMQLLRTAYLLHDKISKWTACRKNPRDFSEEKNSLFYFLPEHLRLYVMGRDEVCSPVFDSLFSRMGDFYLPFFLCDRSKMASASLLDKMPLFLPCLRDKESNEIVINSDKSAFKEEKTTFHFSKYGRAQLRMDTVIFGDHPGIPQLCMDAIAAAQIDDIPFSLTIVSEKADELEERFFSTCPGIADAPQGLSVHRPSFIKLRPESPAFQKYLVVRPKERRESEEERIAALLQSASYLVVYTAEEKRNLTLAMYLREWYLKTDPSFSRLPFIAAYCERADLAEQLRTLTVGSEDLGFSWYNNYNIENFGMDQDLFSYDSLIFSRLEKRAIASHFSYYTNTREGYSFFNSFSSPEDRHRAAHDYYVRSYNRDSSIVNALALPYRLFSAGIAFSDWHSYKSGISQGRLARQFEEWLSGSGDASLGRTRLEVLAMQEHGRWNRAMLSRGWMGASVEQMQTYIQRGVNRHQLYLARLHPFICSWDDLGEAEPEPSGLQKDYGFIMKQIRPGKEPSNIREIDRENVRKTAMLIFEE